jgi:hypothetical protein
MHTNILFASSQSCGVRSFRVGILLNGDGLMEAKITHQTGDAFGGEVVEPDNGGSRRCRGAEVEVVQCAAVRLTVCYSPAQARLAPDLTVALLRHGTAPHPQAWIWWCSSWI